jgi:hypothetical protein
VAAEGFGYRPIAFGSQAARPGTRTPALGLWHLRACRHVAKRSKSLA